jgi:dTDP-4-amino-4,6-dideoxygalactose transaminase
MDEPRAALLSARLPGLDGDIRERRRLTHEYRSRLADLPGLSLPYGNDQVDASSCYIMPVMLEDPNLRDPLREALDRRGIQTTVLYPSISEFSAYARTPGADSLPRCELIARCQLTLPLYPHLGDERLERVVGAVREGLAELGD